MTTTLLQQADIERIQEAIAALVFVIDEDEDSVSGGFEAMRDCQDAIAGLRAVLAAQPADTAPEPYLCIKPACGNDCSGCNKAISPQTMREYAIAHAATLAAQPAPMPRWMAYDFATDVLTIHGKRYSAGMFGEDGFLAPVGTLLRVENGSPDVVTLSRVEQPAPVPDLIPQDALFVCEQMGANVTRVRAESAAPVPALTLNYAQAVQLMAMYADDAECEITLSHGDGHAGKGVYAWYSEHPEEGGELLDPNEKVAPHVPAPVPATTYSSTQATECASCGEHKHTPLRIDAMGGYVCLTCIDQKIGSLLGEFGYPESAAPVPVPLTDEQIVKCAEASDIRTDLWAMGSGSLVYSDYCNGIPRADFTNFVRAIEAHHGIAASPEVPNA